MEEYEYDAHLFGFTVEDFMTAFRQLIEEELFRLTSSMAASLIRKYPVGDPEIDLINDITTSLVHKYMYKAEEPLKTLRAQLKEILHIPPHVLLPDDAAQRTQYSAEEEQEVDDQLKDLFDGLKRTKSLKVELLQERKMLMEVLPDLNKRVDELEKAVAKQQECHKLITSLDTAIDKTVSQTKTLLELPEHLQD